MFDYNDLIREGLIDPDQVWRWLDSFWREYTVPDTEDLIHYESYANQLLALNTYAKSDHFITNQSTPLGEPFYLIPWVPLIFYRDQQEVHDEYLYGDPALVYGGPPNIVYGEASPTVRYLNRVTDDFIRFFEFCDAITDTTAVIDQSQFAYAPLTKELLFLVDPFDLFPVKTSSEGREYITMWARNPWLDLNVPFDQNGWVVKYDRLTINRYSQSLKEIWALVLLGPSYGRYKRGMMRSLDIPFAESEETVRGVTDDGYQTLIATDTQIYKHVNDISAIVEGGDDLNVGQQLMDGITFLEYEQLQTVNFDTLPGLVLTFPLSNGVIAKLTFANIDTDWSFELGRPSEWRFPIAGTPADVEQFWVDVDTYATANSIDLATAYGLPATVNPMQLVIQDFMHSNIFVTSVDLTVVPYDVGGFADRARLLMPVDTLIIVHQAVGSFYDVYDLGTETSETVGYGYNELIPTEVISVPGGGTDLTYFDYAPLVVTT